jgi:hypothetical protein
MNYIRLFKNKKNDSNKKIAVLLTGQLRTYKMLKYLHMNSLISKYNSDVFMGIDVCNELQCEYKNSTDKTQNNDIDDAKTFFKPIDCFILDKYDDKFNDIQKKTNHNIKWAQLLFRQYYIVKNTYKLLIDYINKTNTKYDIIIRLRFDQLIWTNDINLDIIFDNNLKTIIYNDTNIKLLNNLTKNKTIKFDEVEDNTIYVFGFGDFKHYKYANDQFFYHNHSILYNMYNFYDNIFDIMMYCIENNIANKGASIECFFYLYITKYNNIKIKVSNINGIFIREKLK